MPDPDQWRRRVAPEMERLFASAPPRAVVEPPAREAPAREVPAAPVREPPAQEAPPKQAPPAPAFPETRRQAARGPVRPVARPPLEPSLSPVMGPARPERKRRNNNRAVPIAAAVVVGIAIGALGPSAYWRLDQYLHRPVSSDEAPFQLKPALEVARTVPATPEPPASPKLAPRAPEMLFQATVEPDLPPAPAPAAQPAAAPAEPAGGLKAQIAEADRALTQAYSYARRAGVPEPVLEDDRLHWDAVRSDAARRSSVSLLAAYVSRIHDLRGMADEARSQRAADDGGLREGATAEARP